LPVPEIPPDAPLRRSTRDRHPSTRYSVDEFVLLTDGGEPECYAEAMEDEHKSKWIEAMQDEMQSLRDNHTFELVKLPKGKRALTNRWIYRVKNILHSHGTKLDWLSRGLDREKVLTLMRFSLLL